jgi:hypothetical protein
MRTLGMFLQAALLVGVSWALINLVIGLVVEHVGGRTWIPRVTK